MSGFRAATLRSVREWQILEQRLIERKSALQECIVDELRRCPTNYEQCKFIGGEIEMLEIVLQLPTQLDEEANGTQSDQE